MISKKVREFFVSLMEATSYDDALVHYDNSSDCYRGLFNESVLTKFMELGAISLVGNENGLSIIQISAREDFLSSFASGVNEARLGRDQYYADYNANPFAFSVGYEHYLQHSKKKRPQADYFCHGFADDVTEEIQRQ